MMSDYVRRFPNGRRFYMVFGSLIVVAWGLLIILQGSAYAELLDHHAIENNDFPSFGHFAAFLLGWFLMMVAMMLPGSLPALNAHVHLIRQRREGNWSAGLVILGYLFPWVLFGLFLYLGDSLLHQMFDPAAPLAAFSRWIAPAIVLTTGVYQFTPVKRRYTMRCQPSHAPPLEARVDELSRTRALKQGLQLGSYCVGSCWSLMLLMFALGHNRLDWMLALGCIAAAERLAPWGSRLAWLVGAILVAWAAFWLLTVQY